MSLFMCPECGTKISDKARICVYCGYESIDNTLPISVQENEAVFQKTMISDKVESTPFFNTTYEIAETKQNELVLSFFSDSEMLSRIIPGFSKLVEDFLGREERLVADIPKYMSDKIKSGEWKILRSKSGEFFASVRGSKGIVKNIRLVKETVPVDVLGSLNDISNKAMINRLIAEVESIEETINFLQGELHQDRLAEADATMQLMAHVQYIQDSRLRENLIVSTLTTGILSKRKLMRNFKFNMDNLISGFGKFSFKSNANKIANSTALDTLNSLKSISNLVQTEVQCFTLLGEVDAAKNTLLEFHNFLNLNNIYNRDILITLNENLPTNQIVTIEKIINIASNINRFIKEEEYIRLEIGKEELINNVH